MMTFEEFQNHARLYVVGALYPQEIEEFERMTKQLGKRAEEFIRDCYALRDAFALSLRHSTSRGALKQRLMSRVRNREHHQKDVSHGI